MKKVLIGCGVVFLVLIALFVCLLVWAKKTGGKHQEKFFAAIATGDAGKVMAQFHPALSEEVDEPVLEVWIQAVNENLGAYKGLSAADFHTSTKYENGVALTESKGRINFEKGKAQSELKLRDGKLIAFNVTSDSIPKDFFKGPASTDLYRRRGKEFLTLFLENKPDQAFEEMHPNLQKAVPLDKLKDMISKVASKAGALKSITYQSEDITPGDIVKLGVTYKVECEKASTTALVEFQFVGLKGHLVSFDLTKEK